MSDRRSFLRGLLTLPLIGGAVSLIGAPSRVAQAANDAQLEAYAAWCFAEMNSTCDCLEARGVYRPGYYMSDSPAFHPAVRFSRASSPEFRAPLVLSAVGWDGRRA